MGLPCLPCSLLGRDRVRIAEAVRRVDIYWASPALLFSALISFFVM